MLVDNIGPVKDKKGQVPVVIAGHNLPCLDWDRVEYIIQKFRCDFGLTGRSCIYALESCKQERGSGEFFTSSKARQQILSLATKIKKF